MSLRAISARPARIIIAHIAVGLAAVLPVSAGAQTWVTWTSVTSGAAYGSLFGDAIGFAGGNIGGNTSASGTDYFQPSAPYTQDGLVSPDAGGNVGFLQFDNPTSGTFTFTAPVVDLFLAFVSVGQSGVGVSYTFDHPFVVRTSNSVQCAYWGCGAYVVSGNTITGYEYSGTIEFLGPIDGLAFTTQTPEYWHGVTIGADRLAPVTSTPEPDSIALMATGVLALGVSLHLVKLRGRGNSRNAQE